jgi:TPR repeat protein
MYYQSRGIPQDGIEAYKWIYLAVAHGHKDVEPNLELVAQNMWFWNVWKAKRLAREWLETHGGEQ